MSRPASRANLIDYCLRSLGSPVIEINVDDDQIDDRIDEAIQFYQNFHSDAIVRNFFKHKVTQQDVDREYIDLPEELLYVLRVLPINQSGGTSGIFSVDYQMQMNDVMGLRNPSSLVNYEMTRQYMSLIDMTLNGMDQGIIFSRHQNQLKIAVSWKDKIPVGTYVIIEGYHALDPEEYTDVYNDMLLKRYATALIKKQYGTNLNKFSGMQLPGGVTIDADKILTEANTEIEKLEDKMRSEYEAPVDFYCG